MRLSSPHSVISGVKNMSPMQHLLKHCLYPHILSRYKLVSSHLLDVLTNQYNLRCYFKAVQVESCPNLNDIVIKSLV